MTPRALTFDCAQTLVRVRWDPVAWAIASARDAGMSFDEANGAVVFGRLLQGRWAHYRQVNLLRDASQGDAFWRELLADWFDEMGLPTSALDATGAAGNRRLCGPETEIFGLYPDTVPCLERCRVLGVRLAVLSNWDYTLHRVLRMLGIEPFFETVVASLEEGPEKPDPALFAVAASRLGLNPAEIVHVGDDPVDDFQGAQKAGFGAVLLDRQRERSEGKIICTLDDLEGALDCF